MSLADDLARNRRVFERLTEESDSFGASSGVWDAAKKSAPLQTPETARYEFTEPYVPEKSPQGTQGFSLTRDLSGERAVPQIAAQPHDMEYPQLRVPQPATAADPLEELYRRLEFEERMTSQPAGEEDEW